MTPDEHEARLRDAVIEGVVTARWQSIDYDECCGDDIKMTHDGLALLSAALTAYADWLRLRAVAEGCGGICSSGRCGACRRCAAQQQIAAILAAAGGAG